MNQFFDTSPVKRVILNVKNYSWEEWQEKRKLREFEEKKKNNETYIRIR